ncbi:hypothetical protein BDV28DRAFT_127118 [Aspergillus coremiiformis]|uniref:Uncharacterized protein n=1 Tax=Aspergillus coremiiformis TaxID=138285 RepID=A0A5N6ZG90_9EURO|nr:hypothetical protein BDV28DRAFT_127118 [Aspergillus coremiiformis]
MPTTIGRLRSPRAAPAGIGMAITGWSVGDLLGNPIAGCLIAATHADRATIFYRGPAESGCAVNQESLAFLSFT